jgi:hypothetical protein
MKAVILEVRNPDGTLAKRVAVNEDLLKEYLERRKKHYGDEQDLTTLWFFRILAALFATTQKSNTSMFSFTDETGTSRSQYVKCSFNIYLFFDTYNIPNYMVIAIGTDTTSPTRTDYKLGNKINEAVATVTVDETGFTITLSAAFTFASDTVIYEVGLLWHGCVAANNVQGRFLVDRTVFSNGISVAAGQTLSIAYVFSL